MTEAIYKDGVLRLKRPLNLADQNTVHIQVIWVELLVEGRL